MSEFDEKIDKLIDAIVARASSDLRAGLGDLRDGMKEATKDLEEYVSKARALDDVVAIVKLDQVDPDMEAQLLRKIRQVLEGKELL